MINRIWTPAAREFLWQVSSISGTRPTASFGPAATDSATANTMGAWQEILSSAQLAHDVHALVLNFNNSGLSAGTDDRLVDVGVDITGAGTSYQVIIPSLLVSGSGPFTTGCGGVWYYFPIRVPAGSSLAARCQTSVGNNGTVHCAWTAFGCPRDNRYTKSGVIVDAIGIDATGAGAQYGTAVTAGTTSEGAWTDLGALPNDAWWIQWGFSINNSAQSALLYAVDIAIGDASNKEVVISNASVVTTAVEQSYKPLHVPAGCNRRMKAGQHVYGRMQCSGTPNTSIGLGAYVLRG